MTILLHPGELCRAHYSVFGLPGNNYSLVCFIKQANKTSACIRKLDDEYVPEGEDKIVPLNKLWKIKKTRLTQLNNKIQKTKQLKAANKKVSVTNVRPLSLGVVFANEVRYGVQTVAEMKLKNSPTIIRFAFDSVTKFTGDAIVNAANEGCLGGGGIDGAINLMGGPVLKAARQALPILDANNIRCFTGDAQVTPAGDLPCRLVIHSVGPRCSSDSDADHTEDLKVLGKAYERSLYRAQQYKVESIGFCILSAGIFRGSCPLSKIIKTAIESIAKNVYIGLDSVTFCGFTMHEQNEIYDFLSNI